MTNVTFCWQNYVDSATLTKSSQNPSFSVENLKHRWATKTWRSADNTGTLTEWVAADLGSAQAIQFFAIKNHNLSSSAVAKIQADDDPAFGSLGVDVTLTKASGLLAYYWASPQTYRYWRYYTVDSAPLTTYLEAGRMWLGPYFRPALNIVNNYRRPVDDPTAVMLSDGGQVSTNQKTRFRTLSMSFEYLGPDDVEDFETMFMDRGRGRELFFTRDADLPLTTTIYCRIASALDIGHEGLEQYYNLGLTLEELR